METKPTRSIPATAAAKQALARLRADHGDIILHVTGGCCDARTPLCLKADDLAIGPRDNLLGAVEGVPLYQMQSTPDACSYAGGYLLDIVRGVPVGFSIEPADGMRFTLRETAASPAETTTVKDASVT